MQDTLIDNNGKKNASPVEIIRECETYAEKAIMPSTPPIWVFPDPIRNFLKVASQINGFPVGYLMIACISALAVAANKKFVFNVRDNTWREYLSFFCCIVGHAGDGKTHSINISLSALTEIKKQIEAANRNIISAYREEHNKWKGLSPDKRGAEPQAPELLQIIANDMTREAMLTSLKGRSLLIKVDELMGYVADFGRFGNSGFVELMLSLFNNEDQTVLRRTADPILVLDPVVNIIGGIQKARLKEFFADGREAMGFTDRFLYECPPVGDTPPKWATETIPNDIYEGYCRIIERLHDIPEHRNQYGEIIPIACNWTPGAVRVWEKYFIEIETRKKQCHREGTERHASILAKMETYTLRFALMLQVVRYANNEAGTDIDDVSVKGAIELARYYEANAFKVYEIAKGKHFGRELNENYKSLYAALPNEFRSGEGQRIAETFGISRTEYYCFLKNPVLFVQGLKKGQQRKNIES